MKTLVAAITLAAVLGQTASAESVVILSNTDYDCQYVLDNMESDQRLRSFMIDYTFGFLSGMNAQRKIAGDTVLDFSPIDKPMLITWTYQVCQQNPTFNYVQAQVRLFEVLLTKQQTQ